MNLEYLSAQDLHHRLMTLVREERKLTLAVLEHLLEMEVRRLYAERGHSSLFEYCVGELRYSESAAMRRISAMRALKILPDLKTQVESGELKVTQLATLQSFVRMEAKAGKAYSVPERRALFQSACGLSTRETEQLLAEKNPEFVTREKARVVSPTHTQLTFTADAELMTAIQAVRDRFAHRLPAGAALSEVIGFMAKQTLAGAPENRAVRTERSRPRVAGAGSEIAPENQGIQNSHGGDSRIAGESAPVIRSVRATLLPVKIESRAMENSSPARLLPAPVARSRYIPAAVRRAVWTRDEGRCQFVSPGTGKLCGSRHRLEIDHVLPFAHGGSSTDPAGLRLLCFSHNQWESRRVFGERGGDEAKRGVW